MVERTDIEKKTNEDGDAVRRRAVALRYDDKRDAAPAVAAKGRGLVADRIVELAKEHGVTLHEDRDLVEVLFALDLDELIPVDLYQAVAEVLAFVYRMNGKLPR